MEISAEKTKIMINSNHIIKKNIKVEGKILGTDEGPKSKVLVSITQR